MAVRSEIRFLLNDREISVSDLGASNTLLDFLRLDQRLTGTKEGCAEGDCGACTVLVGRARGGQMRYEAVNACIRFLASVDGCHVVSVEHLQAREGNLHPVQQAMVDEHGSQCGFCTPGFVMSLYALWMEVPTPTELQIETALQGNLCRCTGYAPIIRAAHAISRYGTPASDFLVSERDTVLTKLAAMQDGSRVEVGAGNDRAIIPANVDDLAEILVANPDATIVAGATDVGLWVTKLLRPIGPAVFIAELDALKAIHADADGLCFGAGVTYRDAESTLTTAFPHLSEYWARIAGQQVRNMGTIGGNIANGSPIGDTPPVLIALAASITLRHGRDRRTVAVEDFFIEYGKQDRITGDFVETIHIPATTQDWRHAAYKISKRRDEDISSVAAGFAIKVENGTITQARIAFGGMAATPKRAANAEAALMGQPFGEDAFAAAAKALTQDFTPLSDWRASADYRLKVAQNLFRRFWLEQSGSADATRLSA